MKVKSFKEKTIIGLKWSTLNRGFTQVVGLIIGIILARLLSPKEFGVVGMVMVLTEFTKVFIDFGFTSAIIQNKTSDTRHWSSVFWLNILFSFIIAVVLSIFAPLIASFYDKPILNSITIVTAWVFFFQSFNLVQQALMKKDLRFKEIAVIGVVAQVISGLLAIAAALNGMSYWSLIIKLYISTLITSIGLWVLTSWKPNWLFDKLAIKELFQFSLPLVGSQFLNYWTRNIDYLMIGKILGDGALGIYSRAYTLMLSPLQNVSNVISSVMFPAYSIIQKDKQRIKRTYLIITRMIAFITFPAMFGLCVVAEPFVLLLLGDQWEGVVILLQILAPLGAVQSISTLNGNIFLSQGATKLQLKVGGVARLIIIGSMMVGLLSNGLIGIAVYYLISSTLMTIVMFYFMGSLINLSLKEILVNLSKIFLAALVMALGVWQFDQLVSYDWGYLLRLTVLMTTGAVIYASIVLLFNFEEHRLLIKYLRNS